MVLNISELGSIVVTGANRGLGLEFVKQLSVYPLNQVFAIVRDADKAKEIPRVGNVTIIEADITDAQALKNAVHVVGQKVSSLDVLAPMTETEQVLVLTFRLINNAGYIELERNEFSASNYPEEYLVPDLENCFKVNTIGTLLVTLAFLPLLQTGSPTTPRPIAPEKLIMNISSALADTRFTLAGPFSAALAYSISKAAMNMAMLKVAAEVAADGRVVVLNVSPGYVNTQEAKEPSQYEIEKFEELNRQFQRVYPAFEGPSTPEQSVSQMLSLLPELTVRKHNGAFISHWGNQDWL